MSQIVSFANKEDDLHKFGVNVYQKMFAKQWARAWNFLLTGRLWYHLSTSYRIGFWCNEMFFDHVKIVKPTVG